MIPKDARRTEFAGVYRFNNERYLVTAVLAPAPDEYHASVETIHGSLKAAIQRRAELLDELIFKHGEDDIGPRFTKFPRTVVRRPPRGLQGEDE